jgi:hypothetical protein
MSFVTTTPFAFLFLSSRVCSKITSMIVLGAPSAVSVPMLLIEIT